MRAGRGGEGEPWEHVGTNIPVEECDEAASCSPLFPVLRRKTRLLGCGEPGREEEGETGCGVSF